MAQTHILAGRLAVGGLSLSLSHLPILVSSHCDNLQKAEKLNAEPRRQDEPVTKEVFFYGTEESVSQGDLLDTSLNLM